MILSPARAPEPSATALPSGRDTTSFISQHPSEHVGVEFRTLPLTSPGGRAVRESSIRRRAPVISAPALWRTRSRDCGRSPLWVYTRSLLHRELSAPCCYPSRGSCPRTLFPRLANG